MLHLLLDGKRVCNMISAYEGLPVDTASAGAGTQLGPVHKFACLHGKMSILHVFAPS